MVNFSKAQGLHGTRGKDTGKYPPKFSFHDNVKDSTEHPLHDRSRAKPFFVHSAQVLRHPAFSEMLLWAESWATTREMESLPLEQFSLRLCVVITTARIQCEHYHLFSK